MTRHPSICPALLATGAALLLAACGSEPTGQVAAKVDGDEITLTELNTELQGAQIPKGADTKVIQRQALQRVVDRKLLANVAREEKIDQSPEFVVRRQQLEEALLVQMLSQKVARGMKAPTAAELDKFAKENPNVFAGREILSIDQIRFPAPQNPDFLKKLAVTKTMPEVVAVLDAQGMKYERGNTAMDTARIPPQLAQQIRAVPAGEPFVLPAGNLLLVNLVTGSKASPLPPEAIRPVATNGLSQTKLGEALQQRLKAERDKSKVEYQPGFEPPAAAKPGAPAAAAR